MEYYSAIKRNEMGSFAVTEMDLESVISSEASQKSKYHTLLNIYGVQKKGTNEPICRVGIKMQM